MKWNMYARQIGVMYKKNSLSVAASRQGGRAGTMKVERGYKMQLDRTNQRERGTHNEARRASIELCALCLLFNEAIEVRTPYTVSPDADLHRF
jgi:hypothetical protein